MSLYRVMRMSATVCFKEELHVAFLGDLFIVCAVELKIIHFEDYIYPAD